MAFPLDPTLANIFMVKHGSLSERIHKMTFYMRHVNDEVCISHFTIDPCDILWNYNQAHEDIEFTLEMKFIENLRFLYLILSRGQDG